MTRLRQIMAIAAIAIAVGSGVAVARHLVMLLDALRWETEARKAVTADLPTRTERVVSGELAETRRHLDSHLDHLRVDAKASLDGAIATADARLGKIETDAGDQLTGIRQDALSALQPYQELPLHLAPAIDGVNILMRRD